eukprot:5214339-Alexandrium_andersonii.AAC.1
MSRMWPRPRGGPRRQRAIRGGACAEHTMRHCHEVDLSGKSVRPRAVRAQRLARGIDERVRAHETELNEKLTQKSCASTIRRATRCNKRRPTD